MFTGAALALLNIVVDSFRADICRPEESVKQSLKRGLSLAQCVAGYDLYALEVRGLAASSAGYP